MSNAGRVAGHRWLWYGTAAILALAPSLSSCDGDDRGSTQPLESAGVVTLPLEAAGHSGNVYRLVGEFAVEGPSVLHLSTEDYIGEPVITELLSAGDYTVTLGEAWSLLRRTDNGDSPTSNAALVGERSREFSIVPGGVTQVVFTFEVDGEAVSTGGTLEVALSVEERAADTEPPTPEGSFTLAGTMSRVRFSHTATLLDSGRILVAAGNDGGVQLASAELYDPATGAWAAAGSLTTERSGHTATLLRNGKVLVVGGSGTDDTTPARTELYDPASNTWSNAGNLSYGRCRHTATLLESGKVLVAGGNSGGYSGSTTLDQAELYDPSTNTWSSGGRMSTPRASHAAALLPDGKVLVIAGGYASRYLTSAELYDPTTNTWTPTGSLDTGRYYISAASLHNGKVMVIGGCYYANGGELFTLDSTESYDPEAGTWSSSAPMTVPRRYNTVSVLPDGRVLVTGGTRYESAENNVSAELYDPATDEWSLTGSPLVPRRGESATMLSEGSVLVMGGSTNLDIELWRL